MAAALLWYDLETFGTHPHWDRIAQFAAVRTNERFEQLEEPVVSYCRLSPDYVPHPDACLTTGITPQQVNERGVSEREFAAVVHEQMIRPGTTTAGFNTIRFDDEFVRALLYRNFYDPYRREYENGNSQPTQKQQSKNTKQGSNGGSQKPENGAQKDGYITKTQQNTLIERLQELGCGTKDTALPKINTWLENQGFYRIEKTKDLTQEQATDLIDDLSYEIADKEVPNEDPFTQESAGEEAENATANQ